MVVNRATDQSIGVTSPTRLKVVKLLVLAFLVTVGMFLPASLRGIDTHHDGVMFKPAMDVAAGQIIHRDTFTQYGALSTYLQVGFLWTMGKTLMSIKVGTVLCYGITAIFLAEIWRMFLPLPLVIVSLIIWLALPGFYSIHPKEVFLCWSSVYALMFQVMSLYFLLRSVKSTAAINPFLCGVFGALVTWCRTPVGVFHAASVVAFLALMIYATPHRKRFLGASVAYLLGTLLTHGLFFVHLWWIGAIRDWYYQVIAWPAYWVSSESGSNSIPVKLFKLVRRMFMLETIVTQVAEWYAPNVPRKSQGMMGFAMFGLITLLLTGLLAVPQLRRSASLCHVTRGRFQFAGTFLPLLLYVIIAPTFLQDEKPHPNSIYAFAIPIVILSAIVATLLRGFLRPGQWIDLESPAVLALACGLVCLGAWTQFYPLTDPRHRFWAISPGVGLFVYLLGRSSGGRPLAIATALLIFALPLWRDQVALTSEFLKAPSDRIQGNSPLAGMSVPAADAPKWRSLLDALDQKLAERPDVPMLSLGSEAMFGTLVHNLRNPFPFYIVWKKFGETNLLDWSHFGVTDYVAKRQAFIDRYHPIITLNEKDADSLRFLESQGYEEFVEESGLSTYAVPDEVVFYGHGLHAQSPRPRSAPSAKDASRLEHAAP